MNELQAMSDKQLARYAAGCVTKASEDCTEVDQCWLYNGNKCQHLKTSEDQNYAVLHGAQLGAKVTNEWFVTESGKMVDRIHRTWVKTGHNLWQLE